MGNTIVKKMYVKNDRLKDRFFIKFLAEGNIDTLYISPIGPVDVSVDGDGFVLLNDIKVKEITFDKYSALKFEGTDYSVTIIGKYSQFSMYSNIGAKFKSLKDFEMQESLKTLSLSDCYFEDTDISRLKNKIVDLTLTRTNVTGNLLWANWGSRITRLDLTSTELTGDLKRFPLVSPGCIISLYYTKNIEGNIEDYLAKLKESGNFVSGDKLRIRNLGTDRRILYNGEPYEGDFYFVLDDDVWRKDTV